MVRSCGSQTTVGILAKLYGINAAVLSQIRVPLLPDAWMQPHRPYGDISYFSWHPLGGISFCFSLVGLGVSSKWVK